MKEFRIAFTTAVLLSAALYAFLLARDVEPVRPDFGTPHAPEVAAPLALPLGELELVGRVVDETGAGAAEVLVVTRGGEAPHWTFTDARGDFRLGELPSGELEVVLVSPGRLPRTERVELPHTGPALLRISPPRADLEALPTVARSPLAGIVTRPENVPFSARPLIDYELVLRPAPGGDPLSGAVLRRVAADAEGRFLVDRLVHAKYMLQVLPPWAAGGSWPVLGSTNFLHFGGAGELLVPLSAGELAGTIRDSDGELVQGAVVRLTADGQPDQLWPPAASDADGRYRLGDLAPGRYLLRVRAGDERAETTVEVRGGEVGEQPIQLTSAD